MATWKILTCDVRDDRLLQLSADRDDLEGMPHAHGGRPGSVLVLAPSQVMGVLSALASAGAEVARRKKDSRKGLKDSIITSQRVCHRFAGYAVPGRVSSSVRALCRSDEFRAWLGVFVLEVPDRIFTAVWDSSPPRVKGLDAYQQWARTGDMSRLTAIIERDYDTRAIPKSLEDAFVGSSQTARCVRRMTLVAARSDCPVLILGETGTGKEVVAHQIHQQSTRERAPFMAVNCAAIASDLLESEIFGHERGAFTSAHEANPGLVEAAGRGVLFLDEVGDLNPRHQAKLLRLLDSGEYMRVGGTKVRRCEARILAATNCDLARMVEQGRFREDLYARLRSFPIRTPALRYHREDIPTIAEHFWRGLRKTPAPLPPDVLVSLQAYPWRGNVRELKGFLTSLSVMTDGQPPNAEIFREAFEEWTGTSPWHQDQ